MMIDSKTKWSVWGMLFGMAVVLGAGVAESAFYHKLQVVVQSDCCVRDSNSSSGCVVCE